MTAGLVILAILPSSTPIGTLSGLMVLVGLAGPFVSPPVTAVLLNSVPEHQAGTASGVFNTSRQVGGALAVAVFGALLTQLATFMQGMRTSLLLAAGIAVATAAASLLLRPSGRGALASANRHPGSGRELALASLVATSRERGRKLFCDAQASISVPSTEKCSSESSGFTSGWCGSRVMNFWKISPPRGRSRSW